MISHVLLLHHIQTCALIECSLPSVAKIAYTSRLHFDLEKHLKVWQVACCATQPAHCSIFHLSSTHTPPLPSAGVAGD